MDTQRWVSFVKFGARPKPRLDSTAGVFEHYFRGRPQP
jgi:hypothetical protein